MTNKIKIGDKSFPVFFPYAALKELEEDYELDGNEIMAKAAANFSAQLNIAFVGIKYGEIVEKVKTPTTKDDLALFLQPKHFGEVMEIFMNSFPQLTNEIEEAGDPVESEKK